VDVVDWAATSEAFRGIIEGRYEVVLDGDFDEMFHHA
jgi:hypothetical protein